MLYTKKKLKTIGVLGGMGAAASADFYRRLVEIAQKDYHAEADDDFPLINKKRDPTAHCAVKQQ